MPLFYNRLQTLYTELSNKHIGYADYFNSVIQLEELHYEKKNGFICKEMKSAHSLSFELLPFEINDEEE